MPLTKAEREVLDKLLFKWEHQDTSIYGPFSSVLKSQLVGCAEDLRYALATLPIVQSKRRVDRLLKKL